MPQFILCENWSCICHTSYILLFIIHHVHMMNDEQKDIYLKIKHSNIKTNIKTSYHFSSALI